jgi:hypothetical protein
MFLLGVVSIAGSRRRGELTGGTGLERIGDESLTRPDSGFVHGYM